MKYLLLLGCFVLTARAADFGISSLLGRADTFLSTCGLVDKNGYICEIHKVVTDDGYILIHFRVISTKADPTKPRQPVLIQHGVLGSSSLWVLDGPTKSLPFILADANYDVFLMNTRGNTYSYRHKDNLSGSKYWDFSFAELGMYDIPNTIDYVTNLTKQPKVFHIGHSQGTSSFYALLAKKPEYKDKMYTHVTYSPPVIVKHFAERMNFFVIDIALAMQRMGLLNLVRQLLGDFVILPETWFIQVMAQIFCQPYMPTKGLCDAVVFNPLITRESESNDDLLPSFLGHLAQGASYKQVVHLLQLFSTGKFEEYDNGMTQNIAIYGTPKPPEYNLKNVLLPVHVFYSQTDAIPAVDAQSLISMLPNVAGQYDMGECNHGDFLLSKNCAGKVYAQTLQILAKFPIGS